MIGLLINLLFSIIFIIPLLKKGQRLDIYIIWGLYFLSSLLALFYDPTRIIGFETRESYNDIYFVIYGILICYALSPLYILSNNYRNIKITPYAFSTVEKWIVNFVIIGGVFSILYLFPFAIKSLAIGAADIRGTILNDEDISVLPPTLWTTIAVAFATFFSLYLGWFFLSLKSNLKLSQKILLFLISLSYIINSMAYTARDGLLFYVIFGIIFLTNYWKAFERKLKKKLVFVSFIAFSIAIYFLFTFTASRFKDSSEGIMGYIATQPYVFAENLESRIENGMYYGTSLRFPLVNNILGIDVEIFQRSKSYEWTFGTFLTDFYNVNGWFTLIILLICFTEYFRYQFKRAQNSQMKFNLIYVFYVHFIISGLFYFRLGTFSGNVFIAVLVLILFINSQKVKQ